MNAEERNRLFEKFLRNGMSIEEFKFRDIDDKKNLFMVLEEYLKSMLSPDKEIEILPNMDADITVFIDDKEICIFEVDYNLTTIKCHTDLSIENEDLLYCVTMLFLTVKELRTMIQALAKGFSKLSAEKPSTYKGAGKYKGLPKGAKDIVNKIGKIQDSILKNLSDNKKYKKYINPENKDK